MKKLSIPALLLAVPMIVACAKPTDEATAADVARPPSDDAVNMLANAGFESGDPVFSPWTTNVHADPESFEFSLDAGVFRQGKYSLRIERKRDEPFANIAQYFRRADLADRRFRLSAWLRGERLTSPAYLHAIPYTPAGQTTVLGGMDQGLSGSFDWTRLELDIQMPARVNALEVGITTTGDGLLWIDDAELVPLTD